MTTKITVPTRRAALIERSRLIERLQCGQKHTRLTVIIAPAGFGKTTLARQWALSAQRQVAWLSLDTRENDPFRFLTYLTMSIRRVRPGFGDGVLSLLRSPQPPTCEVMVMALLDALSEEEEPLTLVLDDYHLIGDLTVQDIISNLLNDLPPDIHLILASRVDPPLPLARLRARGELTELRAADLRCAGNEVAAFLEEIMGLHLQPEQMTALEERTEGWMAGLQLAGLSLQHRNDPGAFIAAFTGSNRYIVDYLGEEVLRQQSEMTRQFLYRTAILERLNGSLCETVVGNLLSGQGQRLLEEMETGNLFLIPLDDNRRWYRYHHLFGDMLRARLLLEAEAELPELHRRAMCWFESAGMLEEAIYHSVTGGHFTDAIRLMEAMVAVLWQRGEGFLPQRWLAGLPMEYLRRSPVLLLFQASQCLVTSRPEEMKEFLDTALCKLGSKETSPPDLWGQYLALRAFEAGIFSRNEEAIVLAEEALTILQPVIPVWCSIISVLLAKIYAEDGDIQRALSICKTATEQEESVRDSQVTLVIRSVEGALYESMGKLSQAESIYRQAIDSVHTHYTDRLPMTAIAYNGLTNIAYLRNDLSAAHNYLAQSSVGESAVSDDPHAAEWSFHRSYLRIQLALAEGNEHTLPSLFERLTVFAASRAMRQLGTTLSTFRALYALKRGDIMGALEWEHSLRQVTGITEDLPLLHYLRKQSGPPAFDVGNIMSSVFVRLRFQQGNLSAAHTLLADLCEYRESQGAFGFALPLRLLLALTEQKSGKDDIALKTIEPALVLGRQEGIIRPFIDTGNALLPLLQKARRQGIESEFVTSILTHFDCEEESYPSPVSPPLLATSLANQLTEREIEVIRLIAEGLSNQEIADRLYLSIGTVKRHVHNIFGKLDADSRVAAIARAREYGIPC